MPSPRSPAKPSKRKPKSHYGRSFNLMLSKTDYDKLTYLAKHLDLNRAQVARHALSSAFSMFIDGVATCANNRSCFVPHMHPNPPETAHQTDLALGQAGQPDASKTPSGRTGYEE